MGEFGLGVIIFLCVSTVSMGIYYLATGKFIKNAIIGSSIGVATLFIAKAMSGFIGFPVAVNAFTILVSCILGFPGAACTIILNAMFGV